MNWYHKFSKTAQLQDAQDILRVITDTMAEQGYQNFNHPDIHEMANVDSHIMNFLKPQIDTITNQLFHITTTSSEDPRELGPVELNDITLDDRNKINIRIYRPMARASEFNVYINLNNTLNHQNIRLTPNSTIQEINSQLSQPILTFTKEWFNAKMADNAMRNALKDINDSTYYTDRRLEHHIKYNKTPSLFMQELIDKFRQSIGSLLGMERVRSFHKESAGYKNEEWEYNKYWTEESEELFQSLKPLIEIADPEYNAPSHLFINEKTDLFQVLKPYADEDPRGIIMTSSQILNLPYNVLLHTINWLKDKITKIETWSTKTTKDIQKNN